MVTMWLRSRPGASSSLMSAPMKSPRPRSKKRIPAMIICSEYNRIFSAPTGLDKIIAQEHSLFIIRLFLYDHDPIISNRKA